MTQPYLPASVRTAKKAQHILFCILFTSIVFLSACHKDQTTPGGIAGDIIYIESNQYGDNENAVLAYYNDSSGQVKTLPGSPFKTGGAGIGNPNQILGPDDQETPIIISGDKKFLFAVNAGSNTIAAFVIDGQGMLHSVTGSPFSSGGETPQSLSISGSYLYVGNKSQDPLHATVKAPNYNVLKIADNGSLSQVTNGVFETSTGVSTSQVLVSRNKKFVFGSDWLGFMLTDPKGTLRSFTVGSGGGLLTPVAGTPYFIPGMGGALGLWEHPSGNVLYVGFPVQGKVGVYSIDNATGALSFQTSVAAGAAACWLRTNSSGLHLYSLNSGENTISVYNTANPTSPATLQKFTLKQSGPLYSNGMGGFFTTSQPFGLGFSNNEKFLYVVNQHTSMDFSGNYNYLHTLVVATDGTLTEPVDPLQLPVSSKVRPQGIAVY